MLDRGAFDNYAASLGLFEARERCFVYLMRCDRFVKVGIAKDAEARRATLQMTNPFEVTIGKKFSFSDRRYALATERAAHDELAAHRVYGEWFDVEFETAVLVVQEIAAAAKILTRSRTVELQKQYAALWRRYRTDKALQAEVNAADAKRLEELRKAVLLREVTTNAVTEFVEAYRAGAYDRGKVVSA
jgi:hypothetical protein